MSKKKFRKQTGIQTLSAASEEALQQAKSVLLAEGGASAESIAEVATCLRHVVPHEMPEVLRRLAREGQEKSLPLLRALLDEGEDGYAHAVVEAAGFVASPQSAELLTQVAAQTADKQLSKEARRSLQRLRAAGVVVETFVPRGESILSGAKETRFQQAYVSVIDGTGGRMLMAARRMEQPGLVVARAYYTDTHGIAECDASVMKKQEFLEMMATSDDDPFIWTEIPWDYAHYLLNEARQQNLAHGHELPEEYGVIEQVLGEPEKPYEQPLIYHHVNADEVQAMRHYLESSPDLLERAEFDSWWLDRETAEKYAVKWREAEDSWIVLSQPAQKDREDKILHDATDEVFDDATRALFKRRLEEMAYILWKRHGETAAKQAVAAALALAPDAPAPHHNPFAVAMVKRSVLAAAERDKKEERQEGRLYVPGGLPSHSHESEYETRHEHLEG
ncbi:MAG: hypothetical protein NZT92_16940 [Abditibacteriales bacterium]|nr:hypothetical protein [Abditibacteriales bacterium]MDW8367921.1 hypothetical protein [Abditibacteriales bacterium]